MSKNIVMPREFVVKVAGLLDRLDAFDDSHLLRFEEAEIIRFEIKELRKELWDSLVEKAEKIRSRREFVSSGGRFSRGEIIKEIWEHEP